MFTPLTICWVFKQGKWPDNKIERESLVQLICDVMWSFIFHITVWSGASWPLCNSLVNVIEHFNELSIYLRTMDVAWAMCFYCLGALLELEQCLFMSVNVILYRLVVCSVLNVGLHCQVAWDSEVGCCVRLLYVTLIGTTNTIPPTSNHEGYM